MTRHRVLAVVSHYKRTENTRKVCEVLDGEPCDVVVADNSPQESEVGRYQFSGAMDVWRWRENSGPPARWYPAVALAPLYEYVVLIDDDGLPRQGLIDSLLQQAGLLEDKFSNIGPIGRNHRLKPDSTWHYVKRNITPAPGDKSTAVDMSARGYFMRADAVSSILVFRDELAAAGATPEMLWQDDIILNCAIQRETGTPSYLPLRHEPWFQKRHMDTQGYAFSRTQPDFIKIRSDLITLCDYCGWASQREARVSASS